jgi:hypothetical protein
MHAETSWSVAMKFCKIDYVRGVTWSTQKYIKQSVHWRLLPICVKHAVIGGTPVYLFIPVAGYTGRMAGSALSFDGSFDVDFAKEAPSGGGENLKTF